MCHTATCMRCPKNISFRQFIYEGEVVELVNRMQLIENIEAFCVNRALLRVQRVCSLFV